MLHHNCQGDSFWNTAA